MPKCSEIWYFRRELLQRQTFGFKRWNSEFEMVFENAKAHKCNYYAWEHARWLIRYDEKFARKFNTKKFMAMMKISITDCSIFAFAIFMISKFEMLVSDFSKLTKDLLRIYPENKILWNFRFAIMSKNPKLEHLHAEIIWCKQISECAGEHYIRKLNYLLSQMTQKNRVIDESPN